ncbi:hypothetical protein PS862_03863 [Pseudomonas fluorescens]|uniref:Delta-60 repeat protein n=1 Tax=Pseudomonas fluorescens TaxID=294 RepID=A0A5E7M828_PSEFL|nr:delta-60 repeat domain-containing protein [Pseudomonas fluorescens]VVP21133.1 hypothetical protein PS862_03863 [Pseudomonas fluorescens]
MSSSDVRGSDKAGEPDESYGNNGVCLLEANIGLYIFDMAEGNNGFENHFYVTGVRRESGGDNYFLARITDKGVVDPGFGGGYIFGSFATNLPSQALSVSTLTDGRVLISGTVANSYPGLVRFNMDGTPDKTFGVNGSVVLDFLKECNVDGEVVVKESDVSERPRSSASDGSNMIVFPDGSILLAHTNRHTSRKWLIRLKANGSLDHGFQGEGYVDVTRASSQRIEGLALQIINGVEKLVITGYLRIPYPNESGFLVKGFISRYEINGDPDTSFGVNGYVELQEPEESELWGVDIQQDGKILAIGRTPPPHIGGGDPSSGLVVRLKEGGVIEFISRIEKGHELEWISGLEQRDKKIVVVGSYWGGDGGFGVVGRYLDNGGPDTGFGGNSDGIVIFPSPGMARVIAVQSDGALVACGSVSNNGTGTPAILRFLG